MRTVCCQSIIGEKSAPFCLKGTHQQVIFLRLISDRLLTELIVCYIGLPELVLESSSQRILQRVYATNAKGEYWKLDYSRY